MRKILLASTALVAFAGAAQAAESPIQVTLGGSVDFRAALVNESTTDIAGGNPGTQRNGDFQTQYELTVAAEGKADSGIEYGALINLDNDISRAAATATMDMAYVWMSGSFGRVMLGDNHGATLLSIYAPTVGVDQIDGYYMDFTTNAGLAEVEPLYVNAAEDATKITYFTPKVGNDNHKVQVALSFAPSIEAGSAVTLYDATSGYKNQIEAVAKYTGQFDEVSVGLAPMVIVADGMGTKETAGTGTRDYTLWGVGGNVGYAGFTLGASYVDAGHANTATGENRHQDVFTVGLKYEFDKVELAANYLNGNGYYTLAGARRYVEDYDAVGLGATYTWFPGMRTAADAVFFDQDTATNDNAGHVLMLSQKMSF